MSSLRLDCREVMSFVKNRGPQPQRNFHIYTRIKFCKEYMALPHNLTLCRILFWCSNSRRSREYCIHGGTRSHPSISVTNDSNFKKTFPEKSLVLLRKVFLKSGSQSCNIFGRTRLGFVKTYLRNPS